MDMTNASRTLLWGLVCNGTTFPKWQASCLRELLHVDAAKLAVLIMDDAPRSARGKATVWGRYGDTVAARADALQPVDLASQLGHVPVIPRSEAPLVLAARSFDFVLHLAGGPPDAALSASVRHGLWAFQHGEGDASADAPHLREVTSGERVTSVTLAGFFDGDSAPVALHRGVFRVVSHSYLRTLELAYCGSAVFPARTARDLASRGEAAFAGARRSDPCQAAKPAPGSVRQAVGLARLALERIRNHCQLGFAAEQWNIGVVDARVEAFLQPSYRPSVRWFPTLGSDRYLADPFGIAHDGGITVLAEEYDHRTELGHIAIVEAGDHPCAEPVIAGPGHMSYPYLLHHGGELYCIPESCGTRQVRLYRVDRSLREWTPVAVLIDDFAAVDPTVFEHEGRLWLACTDRDVCSWSALHLFHAPDLTGPWTPHVVNPVKTDVRSSRPAGSPFVHEGQLYRPAQDCSRTYGGAVAINRVLRLTPTEFAEEVVRVIEPDLDGPFPDGLHTLAAAGNMTLIDGKRMIFVDEVFLRVVRRRLDNIARLVRRLVQREEDRGPLPSDVPVTERRSERPAGASTARTDRVAGARGGWRRRAARIAKAQAAAAARGVVEGRHA
jgi:hypothetical protein